MHVPTTTAVAEPNTTRRPDIAEHLARLHHFADLDLPGSDELVFVAFDLMGRDIPLIDRASLWDGMREDCATLWYLIRASFLEDDLDEIPEADWARYSFTTIQQEIDHRVLITRERLCDDIERSIALARTVAAERAR